MEEEMILSLVLDKLAESGTSEDGKQTAADAQFMQDACLQTMRAHTYVMTRYLDSQLGKGEMPLDDPTILKFVDDVNDDFLKHHVSGDNAAFAETWREAVVKQYMEQLAPRWSTEIDAMMADKEERATFYAMLSENLPKLSRNKNVKEHWDKKYESKLLHIANIMKLVYDDPGFKSYSEKLSNSTVYLNHWTPYKFLAAFRTQTLATTAYATFESKGHSTGVRLHPLLPFSIVSSKRGQKRRITSPYPRPIEKTWGSDRSKDKKDATATGKPILQKTVEEELNDYFEKIRVEGSVPRKARRR